VAGPLILIVDDSEQNLKLTRDVLVAAGFRTLEAASGAAGIALADEHLPDVILIDLDLPDLDGAEVARKLAAAPRTASISVVLLSAFALEADAEWLRDAHFAGCLAKPMDVERFPEQVRRFCPQD